MQIRRPLSMIIPAYNEEKRLPPTLDIVKQWASESIFDLELIIVDDGSTDNTCELVENYAKHMPYLKLIRANHVGYMNAILTGFRAATKDLVCSLEADCPVHPSTFETFARDLDQHDIVMGSRVLKGGDSGVEGKSLFRKILSFGMTNLFVMLFKCGVYDPQIGFKLFKAEVLRKVLPELRLRHDGLKSAEILIKAHAFGYRIKEIPVKYRHDDDSRCVPKGNYKIVVQAAISLFTLWAQSYIEFQVKLLPSNPVRLGFLSHLIPWRVSEDELKIGRPQ